MVCYGFFWSGQLHGKCFYLMYVVPIIFIGHFLQMYLLWFNVTEVKNCLNLSPYNTQLMLINLIYKYLHWFNTKAARFYFLFFIYYNPYYLKLMFLFLSIATILSAYFSKSSQQRRRTRLQLVRYDVEQSSPVRSVHMRFWLTPLLPLP